MYETVGITLAELCHECLTRKYAGIRSFSGACSYVLFAINSKRKFVRSCKGNLLMEWSAKEKPVFITSNQYFN
jgi:hypothetical protein